MIADGVIERLDLLWEAVGEILVRRGLRETLLGASFLDYGDIVELGVDRIEGLYYALRIEIADRTVIVGADFGPVVDAAHHALRGEDRGDRAVLKGHVDHREILDVVIFHPQVPFVLETVETGGSMCTGRHGLRSDRFAKPGAAFDLFHIERHAQRVHALADHRQDAFALAWSPQKYQKIYRLLP